MWCRIALCLLVAPSFMTHQVATASRLVGLKRRPRHTWRLRHRVPSASMRCAWLCTSCSTWNADRYVRCASKTCRLSRVVFGVDEGALRRRSAMPCHPIPVHAGLWERTACGKHGTPACGADAWRTHREWRRYLSVHTRETHNSAVLNLTSARIHMRCGVSVV